MKTSQRYQLQQGHEVVSAPGEAVPLAPGAGLGGLDLLDELEHDAAQDGEVLDTVADVQPAIVLAEDDMQHLVAVVLDLPMLADASVELAGVEGGGADAVAPLDAELDHDSRPEAGPVLADRFRQRAHVPWPTGGSRPRVPGTSG